MISFFKMPKVCRGFYPIFSLYKSKCYFNVLGLKPQASLEEVKEAYYRLSKKFHPDMNVGNEQATGKIQEINEAFEELSKQVKNEKKMAAAIHQKPAVRRKNEDYYILNTEPKFHYYKPPDYGQDMKFASRTRETFYPGYWTVRRPGLLEKKKKYARMNAMSRKSILTKDIAKYF